MTSFAMMTCPTLGAAPSLGMTQQKFTGSMLEFDMQQDQRFVTVSASNRFHEPDIQMFLVEEAFASFLQIARGLVGNSFVPHRIDLAYEAPEYAAEYARVFQCPVRFGQAANVFVTDIEWVARPLLTYDPLSHRQALEFMEIGF
jgi:hypothetical protein